LNETNQAIKIHCNFCSRDGTQSDWHSGEKNKVSVGIWAYTDRQRARDSQSHFTSVPETLICIRTDIMD